MVWNELSSNWSLMKRPIMQVFPTPPSPKIKTFRTDLVSTWGFLRLDMFKTSDRESIPLFPPRKLKKMCMPIGKFLKKNVIINTLLTTKYYTIHEIRSKSFYTTKKGVLTSDVFTHLFRLLSALL